jgi:endoglucanase
VGALSGHGLARPISLVAGLSALALVVTGGGLGAAPAAAAPAESPAGLTANVAGFVRLDSVGYLPGDVKQAYLLTTGPVSGVTYAVHDQRGRVVLRGQVDDRSRGAWNKAYPDVYGFTFSRLRTPGIYHVVVSDSAVAASPSFAVEDAADLYGQLVRDGVAFYQNQRDGADQVPGPLNRQPSHLNDAHATVYQDPTFVDSQSDTIRGATLIPLAGAAPVDAAGGWFDAGDFLKFTHTTAFGDVLLYASARALGRAAPASLLAEARHGEAWLNDMWDQKTQTLYLQVGIGTGNQAGTFFGDHDLWRLPQADDHDTSVADRFAAAHRPVFVAAPAGSLISPNLVGRVSAAFALAAQTDARTDPARAVAELRAATSLYARANTAHPPNPLVTSLPFSYYPETTWRDDMELGAAEIALAAEDLGRNPRPYLRQAATWAAEYIAKDTGDTFNLYDTSALAHTDLIEAIRRAGSPAGLAVSPGKLVDDLRRQIEAGVEHAASDVFGAAGDATNFDVDSHTFGWIAMVGMYDQVTGDHRFDPFAADQRAWLFGANAWGASFMVGEGTNFPACMQHQVANLSGSLDGSPPLDVGAVVNGPNSPSQFAGGLGGLQTGMRKCPAGPDVYRQFTGHGSRYVDDVRAWQTAEPALDMTGSAIIAAAYQEAYG